MFCLFVFVSVFEDGDVAIASWDQWSDVAIFANGAVRHYVTPNNVEPLNNIFTLTARNDMMATQHVSLQR